MHNTQRSNRIGYDLWCFLISNIINAIFFVFHRTPMKNDYKKDLNRTPLTTKDVRVLSQSHSFCGK